MFSQKFYYCRLMVVAEKETVYNTFAIPLINRLEKHILSLTTILTTQQQQLSILLERWVKAFCSEEGLKRHDTYVVYKKNTAFDQKLFVERDYKQLTEYI